MSVTRRPEMSVDDKIADLYQITETVDGRVARLAPQMDRRFDVVDDRLGRLETDVSGLKSDMGAVKSDLAKVLRLLEARP